MKIDNSESQLKFYISFIRNFGFFHADLVSFWSFSDRSTHGLTKVRPARPGPYASLIPTISGFHINVINKQIKEILYTQSNNKPT